VLSARRTQLRVVHVKLTHDLRSLIPAGDILAAFRELAADGMELYIGTERHNYVSG
jgi:aryl-alcohol dehydrogenase-like predicted oxidoreductase